MNYSRHVPKSDVMQYDNTADVTLPKKRGAAADDDDEKPVAKKIKVLFLGMAIRRVFGGCDSY